MIADCAFLLIGTGLLLTILGGLHPLPAFERWDARTFQRLHARLRPFEGFFRYIWPLGTTPVGLVLMAIIFMSSWQTGLAVSATYLLAALLERTIKTRFRRARPFNALADVQMRQPSQPHDYSHPSGDTLRVWFLACVFPWAFALAWPVILLTCVIAGILSLGRVALGVHYPLDVLGGAGLGLTAAGIAILSFQLSMGGV